MMMRNNRKAISDVLRTVIRLAVAILVILVLIPIVATGAQSVSDGGCAITTQVWSAIYSVMTGESIPDVC